MRSTLPFAATAVLALLVVPAPAGAQSPRSETLSPVEIAAACAPVPSVAPPPAAAFHVAGSQDTVPRTAFGSGDLMVVDGGTKRGLHVDQEFYIRHPVEFGTAAGRLKPRERPIHTAGWLRIVSVNETAAVAAVLHACGSIHQGDYLEPFARPALPAGVDRVDTSGTLDFAAPGHVLFGDMDRLTGGPGDFMVVDRGEGQGVAAGARFAIYRELENPASGLHQNAPMRLPLTPVGEAIVVSAAPSLSLVRILSARDAVRSGDLIVPRK